MALLGTQHGGGGGAPPFFRSNNPFFAANIILKIGYKKSIKNI